MRVVALRVVALRVAASRVAVERVAVERAVESMVAAVEIGGGKGNQVGGDESRRHAAAGRPSALVL